MKNLILLTILLFVTCKYSIAQQNYYGVQNSHRKGMINAMMNPAEINNLTKKVEVSLFSFNIGLDNNVLSVQDIIDDPDVLENIFDDVEGPVNLRTDVSVLGPAVGLRFNKWSFGITTEIKAKADIIDFNPDLGSSIIESSNNDNYQTIINIPENQRVNATGWMEIGFLAGRKILDTDFHSLSVGANFKLLLPGSYTNFGMDNINATIIYSEDEILLTDAQGSLNLSYDERLENDDDFNIEDDLWRGLSPSGLGVDLGVNYMLKRDKKAFLNLGLSLKNMGSMRMGNNQRNKYYSMNIPQNEYFRTDNLEGSIEEIEQQLVDSGYFNISNNDTEAKISMPRSLSAYVEFSPAKIFQVSLYGQKRVSNENNNFNLSSADLLVLTPRLVLGKFELYSPWMQHQVSGLTGGLGFQVGGFFVGSQSIITSVMKNNNRADVHMGFSLGFGS
ncbi:DUF5723 family protein [Cyclobacterium marinum]|uniref:Uncharacterized protein n=1 Tax=Cyclobacterium marinum (strain ATCC 25205 / DSM 745 / LMG 13164 / NCIMB 1802) TaxID=880070 RepID=G0IYT1_CYCMS|nr:DUF5723 family protein [Cyclobacterium marinum]AEL27264.1 hypothetical protein Cycma_3544 [Cyclobacterium marinum DSM 745]|tara:strand:+ start:12124 stop:13461 length:1338 start_codon:yes stop_codon:yes gene_type:complete